MKRIILSFLAVFFIYGQIFADGISPVKRIKFQEQTTKNILASSTAITRTNDGYVYIIPTDGDIRVNLNITANATYDPIVYQDSKFVSPYLKQDDVLNAISDDGTTVSVTIIVENY